MRISEVDLAGVETLLLDRDGVINRLRPNDYVKCREEFEFMPGILEAIARWSSCMRHIFIVTNQRGVGKGLMSEADLQDVHSMMLETIEDAGGRVDAIYYCTALDKNDPRRKPQTGMFDDILRDYPDVDAATCAMVGDSESDMQFARNCGIRGILIDG